MTFAHAIYGLIALTSREVHKFVRQTGRLISAVSSSLWLLVFAAGFQNVFGVAVVEPYETYVRYEVYMVPGLLGMVLLFNGMQSSLAMVYDREMGIMRFCWRHIAALVSAVRKTGSERLCLYCKPMCLCSCVFCSVSISHCSASRAPIVILVGMMLGALGLLLSVYIKQLENFAGTMNFVIFPMFFISSAISVVETGGVGHGSFTRSRSGIRLRTVWSASGLPCTGNSTCHHSAWCSRVCLFFALAVWGYDPQRGLVRLVGRG